MSARHKLNDVYLWTIVWITIGLTVSTQSLTTGLIGAVVLYSLYFSKGFIRHDESSSTYHRPPQRRRHRRR